MPVERVGHTAAAVAAVALALIPPAVAVADDEAPQQHNVTYRARIDGVSRGALITYRISDTQVNSTDPTMLPGRIIETTAVLTDPKEAGMRISIQWPYSANLHCEILVDDQVLVQADQFIGPRLIPARDDPDYGAMNCGAPLSNATGAPGPAPTISAPLPGEPVPGDPTDLAPLDAPPADPSATGMPTN